MFTRNRRRFNIQDYEASTDDDEGSHGTETTSFQSFKFEAE